MKILSWRVCQEKEIKRKRDWQKIKSDPVLMKKDANKKKDWARRKTKKYGHGGGVGIQTHGNKLASALNTKTPDHSVYLNEDGYLKGGIKVRS